MLAKFILRALFAAAGLWLASQVVPGVVFQGAAPLIGAALLLGVVNAVVRPVVVVLTLPITLLTLGLFLLVVNAGMIGLVALMLDGFVVRGVAAGLGAALVTGVVSWAGHILLPDAGRR